MKRITWGHPVKSLVKAEKKLRNDLRFYGGIGAGNCAKLNERHPEIVKREHWDGSAWYHTEVDDITLDLEFD